MTPKTPDTHRSEYRWMTGRTTPGPHPADFDAPDGSRWAGEWVTIGVATGRAGYLLVIWERPYEPIHKPAKVEELPEGWETFSGGMANKGAGFILKLHNGEVSTHAVYEDARGSTQHLELTVPAGAYRALLSGTP